MTEADKKAYEGTAGAGSSMQTRKARNRQIVISASDREKGKRWLRVQLSWVRLRFLENLCSSLRIFLDSLTTRDTTETKLSFTDSITPSEHLF